MSYDEICNAVAEIKKKYDEKDPVRLCTAMGIILLYTPMEANKDSIKGFFLENRRIKTITVNSDLPLIVQKFVIGHELGHAVLHRKQALNTFHEISSFNESNIYEKEANLFAAEYLLEDEEVLNALNSDNTFFSTAATLHVPVELLDFKFRLLKWKGYRLNEQPITAPADFFKDLPVNYDTDDLIDW